MTRALVIVGAGGGSRELLAFLPDINAAASVGDAWKPVAVLDDDPALRGRSLAGVPIVGGLEHAVDFEQASFLIGVANQKNVTVRREVWQRLGIVSERLATLVHPRAYCAPTAHVEPGCVVYPHASVGPDVTVGPNTVVYFNTVVHHDARIGSHCAVCAHVCVAGHAVVDDCAYVGAGAMIRDGRRVGSGALVGMGSVVTRDVAAGDVVVGVPAQSMCVARSGGCA